MWGKIIIPMYRLWLNGLYGLYGPRCPLSSKRPINLTSLSLWVNFFSKIGHSWLWSGNWVCTQSWCNICIMLRSLCRFCGVSLLMNSPAISVNTLRPRQNSRHFADDIFKCIFLNENVWISLKISLKFVPQVQINNHPALIQIMAWRRPGDKPLSEPMMVSLLTHICVTRPQWVNSHH